jgi:hypothetical protein
MGIMRLSTIRTLYGSAGPWASVYLDATGTQKTGTPQETRRELDLRWRAARDTLRGEGADEATLRAIDETVRNAPSGVGPAEVAVLASGGQVAFSRALPVAPPREAASWSAQPHAAELLRGVRALASSASRDAPGALASLGDLGGDGISWVRADIDRTGGSVNSSDGHSATIRGEDEFVSKHTEDGRARIWSQARDQRAAEENWDINSTDVARAITAEVERCGADVIILAGEVRARQLVFDRLPTILASRVTQVDHEAEPRPHPESRVRDRREADVYDAELETATRDIVEAAARDRRAAAIDRFHSGLSDGDSVRGVEAVSAAARDLRIDTLVLSADPSHQHVWVDPLNPTMVGPAKRDTGVTAPAWEPADDALVGAAAFAGADSIIIDPDIELVDGVGAILRFQPTYAPR